MCSDSQDSLSELRTFIAGASRVSDINQLNLVRTAISLLKTLPAANEAVLEYFCSVFHNYVARYLSLLEVVNVLLPKKYYKLIKDVYLFIMLFRMELLPLPIRMKVMCCWKMKYH